MPINYLSYIPVYWEKTSKLSTWPLLGHYLSTWPLFHQFLWSDYFLYIPCRLWNHQESSHPCEWKREWLFVGRSRTFPSWPAWAHKEPPNLTQSKRSVCWPAGTCDKNPPQTLFLLQKSEVTSLNSCNILQLVNNGNVKRSHSAFGFEKPQMAFEKTGESLLV